MSTIISPSDFILKLKLPVDNIDIQVWINDNETDILDKILGVELSDEFTAALVSSPAQKWLDLRNGVKYTDDSDNKQRYKGIKRIITEYVYVAIVSNYQTESTDSGIKRPAVDNAEDASPGYTLIQANNDMVNRISVMNDFINRTNEITPDTYENYLPEIIEKINTFDL